MFMFCHDGRPDRHFVSRVVILRHASRFKDRDMSSKQTRGQDENIVLTLIAHRIQPPHRRRSGFWAGLLHVAPGCQCFCSLVFVTQQGAEKGSAGRVL